MSSMNRFMQGFLFFLLLPVAGFFYAFAQENSGPQDIGPMTPIPSWVSAVQSDVPGEYWTLPCLVDTVKRLSLS
jgi:hypothetical protein